MTWEKDLHETARLIRFAMPLMTSDNLEEVPWVPWSGRVVAGKRLERADERRRACAGPDCLTMVPRDRLLCHWCRR